MNKTFTATNARRNFFQVLKEAAKPGRTVTITLEGQSPVILMSQEEFEGWQETLDIMSDPQLMKDIRDAEKETETVTLEEILKKHKA